MRAFIGILLILHGLAHAGAGMWAAGPVWLITILWWLSTALYISAGLGVLGFRRYSRWTVELAFAAVIPSALLLGSYIAPFIVPGIALDLLLLVAVVRLRDQLEPIPTRPLRYRGTAATNIALAFLLYTSSVILLRPWAMRMGTTAELRRTELFGDSLHPGARYYVDNAIMIDAPADSVWPWIAQMAQDRGWRLEAIDPGRGLVLENRGAFVVTPIDSARSRFHIRQRNTGSPSFVGSLIAPVGLLVLEPAHFIMQRGMLAGVKRRAEGTVRRS